MAFPVIPLALTAAGTAVTGFVSNAVSSFFDMVGKEEETKKESYELESLSLVPEVDRGNAVAYQSGLNPASVFQNISGGGFGNDYSQVYTPTVNTNTQYQNAYYVVSNSPNSTIKSEQDAANKQEASPVSSGSALSDIVNNLGVYAPYIAVGFGAYFLLKGLGGKPSGRGSAGYRRYNRSYNRGYYNSYNPDFGSSAYWQYMDNRDARRFEYRTSRINSFKDGFKRYSGSIGNGLRTTFKRGTDYFTSSRNSGDSGELRAKRSMETREINGGIKFND